MGGEPHAYSDHDVDEIVADKDARIAELEAALDDAYSFVLVAVNQYRLDFELDRLHDTHADIADRIARLLGKQRIPSEVLKR